METANTQTPEVEEQAKLTLGEKLGQYIEAVRLVRIKHQLESFYRSDLEDTELKNSGAEMKFSRDDHAVELSFLEALDDEDEVKTVIIGEWDRETESICFASAYQLHFSSGNEKMVRQWDPNRYPKPQDQMKTSEVLSDLRTLARNFLAR